MLLSTWDHSLFLEVSKPSACYSWQSENLMSVFCLLVSCTKCIWAQFSAGAQQWKVGRQMRPPATPALDHTGLRSVGACRTAALTRFHIGLLCQSASTSDKRSAVKNAGWGWGRDRLSGITALRNTGLCKALSRLSANSLLSYKTVVSLVDVSAVIFFMRKEWYLLI